MQAVCQDTLRAFIRTITSNQVMDLKDATVNHILEPLNVDMGSYGVKVMKIKVIFAQPPASFMRSQEARQLAILQQAEQEEAQALAIRRQKDTDALAFQQVLAEVERDKEILRLTLQKAEMRRRVEETEAETEEFRLARKEEHITKFPQAWAWERELMQLEVARAGRQYPRHAANRRGQRHYPCLSGARYFAGHGRSPAAQTPGSDAA